MLRTHVRRLATARAYTATRVGVGGDVQRFVATPRDLVDNFGLLPRDCRLLATANAHIAVRQEYFLFRFPPFTGAVRHDEALLIADQESQAATELLQQRLVQHATAGHVPHPLTFEHQ